MHRSRRLEGADSVLVNLSGDSFFKFLKMSSCQFQVLLANVEPKIRKKENNWGITISERNRLAIALRFLATGDSFASIAYLFGVSRRTVSTIVMEVCRAIREELKEYIKVSYKMFTIFN